MSAKGVYRWDPCRGDPISAGPMGRLKWVGGDRARPGGLGRISVTPPFVGPGSVDPSVRRRSSLVSRPAVCCLPAAPWRSAKPGAVRVAPNQRVAIGGDCGQSAWAGGARGQ